MDNMKYKADSMYYKTKFRGKMDLKHDEIESLLMKAYDNIMITTMGRSMYLNKLSKEEVEIVKRAACYEAEAIYTIEGTMGGTVGLIEGWNIDGVSVNLNTSNNSAITEGGVLDKRALNLLEQTRLRSREFERW